MTKPALASGAQGRWINGGRRLHLQHGPIDLVVSVEGEAGAVREAYARAIDAFPEMLPALVAELSLLRAPIMPAQSVGPSGRIAQQMFRAASVYADRNYVTPMVAVAGAVADDLLATIVRGKPLARASVNNGGDIALHLGPDECFRIGVCDNVERGTIASRLSIRQADRVGGVATSGWAGRSHSFGIADAVTVLASNAACADCAATMIANAVNLPANAKIQRLPASGLFPDSDLGDALVTVGVDQLTPAEVSGALHRGAKLANQLLLDGMISGAFLALQGEMLVIDGQQDALDVRFKSPTGNSLTKVNS